MTSHIQSSAAKPEYANAKAFILLAGVLALNYVGFRVIYFAMAFVEARSGVLLFDPLHAILPEPINLSNAIFVATYSSAFIINMEALTINLNRFSHLCLGYALLLFLRSFSMIMVPLDAPDGLILLIDPFINYFHAEPFVATKDLFFFGHCSALAFFYLMARNKYSKFFLAIFNIFVISAISIQRVHYTIDIIAGLIVAYCVYRFTTKLYTEYFNPLVAKPFEFSLQFKEKSLTKK